MKVLSLFDGISCGRLALERAGIPKEALSDDCFVEGISIGCDKFCPLLVAGKCTLPKKEQKQILKG